MHLEGRGDLVSGLNILGITRVTTWFMGVIRLKTGMGALGCRVVEFWF